MKTTGTFTSGIMNKNLDERLIPKGQYRDGLNIGVSTSEASNVGAIENILGNVQSGGDLSFLSADAVTIGAIAQGDKEQFFWFVTDTDFDYVLRYHEPSNTTAVILKDTKGRVLKFDKEHIITGVNLIDDYLFWTDNLNQPRRILSSRTFPLDGFEEDDIRVIRKPPLYPPQFIMKQSYISALNDVPDIRFDQTNNIIHKYFRFAYRWKYEYNEYSSLSPFTATAFQAFYYQFDYANSSFFSMQNSFDEIFLQNIATGDEQVTDIQVVFYDEYTGSVYIVDTFDKAKNGWADNTEVEVNFNNNKISALLANDEVTRLFDNVPLRAKAQEVIGSRLIYGNYVQGYDLRNTRNEPITIDFYAEQFSIEFDGITAPGAPFSQVFPRRSFHSNRNYEVGLVYLDDYGRMSTVLTPEILNTQFTNTVAIPPTNSDTVNDIRVYINSEPPQWASKYRIFIKQSDANDYVTIWPLFSISAGDGDYWFRILSSDVNKVPVGNYIYIKSLNGNVFGSSEEFKVLALETKEEGFLQINNTFGSQTDAPAGTYFKLHSEFTDLSTLLNLFDSGLVDGAYTYAFTDSTLATTNHKRFYGPLGNWVSTSGTDPGIQSALINGLTGGRPTQTISQIDPPIYYGNSGYFNEIELRQNWKASPYETSSLNDQRLKVKIYPNGQFMIERYDRGNWSNFQTWQPIDIAPYVNSDYLIGGSGSGVNDNLWVYIRFNKGINYVAGDYFIINIHTAYGNNPHWIPIKGDGVYDSSNGIYKYEYQANQLCLSVAPDTIDSYYGLSQPMNSLNSYLPLRDVPINPGAIIEITIAEAHCLGGEIEESVFDNTETVYTSAPCGKRYKNIEEWWYEEEIWRDIEHKWAYTYLPDGSGDHLEGTNGERFFFRRTLNYKTLDWQTIPGAGGPSGLFGGTERGNGGNLPSMFSLWQAYSDRSPADDGVGNYATYAEMVTIESGIQMFVAAQGTHKGVQSGNKVWQIASQGRLKIYQVNDGGNPILETKPTMVDDDIYHEAPFTFDVFPFGNRLLHEGNIANQTNGGSPAIISLNPGITTNSTGFPLSKTQFNSEFNCYTFGNGVESTKIKGELSEAHFKYSPRVSSFIEKYQQEYLPSSLTYSGVFVNNTNVNNLNEFNLSLGNYKDLSREYGPVEKLHSRDNDLIALQEDKVSKVLYGKNLLSDATGGGSIASIPEVLGTQIPYVGEYGISNNPESFAAWGPNMFFTDVKRGAVLRLGRDGLFEISNQGMTDYFKDLSTNEFKKQKLGCIDPFKEQYVLSSTETLATACTYSLRPGFIPRFPRVTAGTNYIIEIFTSGDWLVEFIDTGDGTNWLTVNGQTPALGGFGDETLVFNLTNNGGLGSPSRQCEVRFTFCDGTQATEIFKQSGAGKLTGIVYGVGGPPTGGKDVIAPQLKNTKINFEVEANPGGLIQEFIDQPIGNDAQVITQRETIGIEGEDGIPTEGDDVTITASQIGAVDTLPFCYNLGQKMYYLVSDTFYTSNQIDELINDPNTVEIVPTVDLVTGIWTGDYTFNRPTDEAYVYNIIDYRSEIEASATAQFDLPAQMNNVTDTFRGKVDFTDKNGNVEFDYTINGTAEARFRVLIEGRVISTTGETPVSGAGTMPSFNVPFDGPSVYDVEIDYFAENESIRLITPLPTLTEFNYEVAQGSLNPTDPTYVCTAAPAYSSKWHDGTGALPEIGNIVYENPFGTTPMVSPLGIHSIDEDPIVGGNQEWLQFDASSNGKVLQRGVCTPCTEVAVPVVTVPPVYSVKTNEEFNVLLEATNNPTEFEITSSSTCVTYSLETSEGGTVSYTDCAGIAQNITLTSLTRNARNAPNTTTSEPTVNAQTIISSTVPVVTSGQVTVVTLGLKSNTPPGFEFDNKEGRMYMRNAVSGVFEFNVIATNCFGSSAPVTVNITVVENVLTMFQMDIETPSPTSALACAITSNYIPMFHTGSNTFPEVNDIVSLPQPDKGESKSPEIGGGFGLERGIEPPSYNFKGGYNWYKANFDSGPGNGSVLLIDDTGVIIEIIEC